MFGIYSNSYNQIIDILKEFHSINEVIIYGSRAKNSYREGSDIDLTIKGDVSLEDINKLWHKLDDSCIPYKFDISRFQDLKNQKFIEHINRVGKIFYKKEDTE
jgi:predicted nucleotidyltransferase